MMITYFEIIAFCVFVNIFSAYKFYKKSDGFFLAIFLGSLCSGISYTVIKSDNFNEISSKKYEEVIRDKAECDKYTECSKLYKEIIKDNKITGFEYQDFYIMMNDISSEIDKKNEIDKKKIDDEKIIELKKKL